MHDACRACHEDGVISPDLPRHTADCSFTGMQGFQVRFPLFIPFRRTGDPVKMPVGILPQLLNKPAAVQGGTFLSDDRK